MTPSPGSATRPELVVTLPGRTPEELKGELALAQAAGADLVEFRLDRMRREDIPRLEILHQIPILHEWVPAIATVRSRAEGGEGPDDVPTRQAIVEEALQAVPFTWVDLEVARDRPLREALSSSYGRMVGIIGSAHLPAETSPEALLRAMHEATQLGDIGKVVLPAPVRRVTHELIPLCEGFEGTRYVLHTTGPSAPLLRVMARKLRMALVYAGLPEGHHRVEPGQPPADRMRLYLDTPAHSPWYAVLGRPVTHSLSPALHHGFLEIAGLPGLYVPLELADAKEFREEVPRLFGLGARGFNVTRPFKSDAAQLATDRDELTVVARVANTLLPPGDRGIRARNTDVQGLERILQELEHDGRWKEPRFLVVGSGGLARAAVAAGMEVGARVKITARTRESAERLAAEFPPEAVTALPSSALRPEPLVVHTTPAGQDGTTRLEVPIAEALGPGTILLDGIYLPVTHELEDLARSRQATYLDGWRLLVYQAALSFQEFTGTELPWETVLRVAASPPVKRGTSSS